MKSDLCANEARLWRDWERLSSFRQATYPGWTRRVFSPEYQRGRRWLRQRMQDAGLKVELDAGGNLIGRRDGRMADLPPIVIGSHTDTVAGGGRFDGIVGVLAGIEAARTLSDAGCHLDHPLEVIDMLGEEPNDFGLSMLGSRALAGQLTEDHLARTNSVGQTLAEAIAAAGGRPTELARAARTPGSIAVYFELHIEQGTALEQRELPLGVVSAITGVTRYLVTCEGRADHAGGTPMTERCDALVLASEVVLAVEDIWHGRAGVGTVGRMLVEPNAINVVPARVQLWIDMRTVNRELLAERQVALSARLGEIGSAREGTITSELLSHEDPVEVSPDVRALLAVAVKSVGSTPIELPSLAGHDANQMAKVAPIGMIFVPSVGGRSHCPEEWTKPEEIAMGVTALCRAVVAYDERPC